jgi:hypothetical protein
MDRVIGGHLQEALWRNVPGRLLFLAECSEGRLHPTGCRRIRIIVKHEKYLRSVRQGSHQR